MKRLIHTRLTDDGELLVNFDRKVLMEDQEELMEALDQYLQRAVDNSKMRERERVLNIIKLTNTIHSCDQFCDPEEYCLSKELLVAMVEIEETS